MRSFPPSLTRRPFALAALALVLGGCSSVDRASRVVADSITPYRVEIVQGNFVSREQVDLLKKGMSRVQVREVLGTPLLTDIFHADRWDYVFTLRRQSVPLQQKRLTLFFKGDALDRWEGDEMPGETEFVTAISKRREVKVPVLEATPEQLRAAAAKPSDVVAAPAAEPAPAAAAAVNYPPLEPAR